MTKKEAEMLLYKVDMEGFDYCFTDYSDWEEIEDKQFHLLREKYIEAANNLEQYLSDLRDKYDIKYS